MFVNKDLHLDKDLILSNADCAEEFTISSTQIEPGYLVVLKDEDRVTSSNREYDKRVAGVISGTGKYKPGIILDKKDTPSLVKRLPVALMGKVYCKVVAEPSPIEIGDLLTTSNLKGHAMKDSKSF